MSVLCFSLWQTDNSRVFDEGGKDEKTQNQQKLKQNIIIYTHIERYKKLCHGVSFFFLSFFLSLEHRQWFGCLPLATSQ